MFNNKFLVGIQGDTLALIRPIPTRLSGEDAVLLAAWLVTMSEMLDGGGRLAFESVISEIHHEHP